MSPPPNRFSLSILMGFIGVLAVGLGLMRNGSPLASRITLAILPVVLLVGLLGALVRRGDGSWVGFALFGWSYALLAFVLPNAGEYGRQLNPGADLVQGLVNGLQPEAGPAPAAPVFNPRFESMIGDRSHLRWAGTGPGMNSNWRSLLSPPEISALDAYLGQLNSYDSAASLLAGRKANARIIGHALFALIFALVGSVVGRALGGPAEIPPSRQAG